MRLLLNSTQCMTQIIAVVIGLLVLLVGFVIYRIGLEILDEGDYFFYAVGFFLLLFVVAGMALYFLLPRPPKAADLGSVAPGQVLNQLTRFSDRFYSDELPVASRSISYSVTE